MHRGTSHNPRSANTAGTYQICDDKEKVAAFSVNFPALFKIVCAADQYLVQVPIGGTGHREQTFQSISYFQKGTTIDPVTEFIKIMSRYVHPEWIREGEGMPSSG